jgi:hypothetical protein
VFCCAVVTDLPEIRYAACTQRGSGTLDNYVITEQRSETQIIPGIDTPVRGTPARCPARPARIAQFRSFRFERSVGGFAINGNFFDVNVDNAAPRAGDYEVWNFENDSGGWFHPVHLHLLHAGFGFVVIDRNGIRRTVRLRPFPASPDQTSSSAVTSSIATTSTTRTTT